MAVGAFTDQSHKKAELFDTRSTKWASVEDYPFEREINSVTEIFLNHHLFHIKRLSTWATHQLYLLMVDFMLSVEGQTIFRQVLLDD